LSQKPEAPVQQNLPRKNIKGHSHTNRLLIRNAICHVCLAGRVNEREKSEILSVLNDHDDENDHFVILVRDDKSPVFKALYTLEQTDSIGVSHESNTSATSNLSAKSSGGSSSNHYSNSQLKKIIGKGPKTIPPDLIKAFFRYDSGGKRFINQRTTSFAVTTAAVVLNEQATRKLLKK
jgi:hypothetical protein